MSKVKLDFLNWRPDLEDYDNQGLIEAQNVFHQPEGWKEYKTPTVGAFVTNTALGTCPSVVIKSVGTNNQRIAAFLHNPVVAGAGATIDFSIGIFSQGYTTIGLYTTYTSSTISSLLTGNNVMAFDVCELDGLIFFSAQAELPTATILNAAAPVITLNSTGYATI